MRLANKRFTFNFWTFVTVFYIFAFGLSLVTTSFFWDDWVWINRDADFFADLGKQMGTLWFSYWSRLIFQDVLLSRVASLLVNFISIVLVYKISKYFLSENKTRLVVLLFAFFPTNPVRAIASVSQYSLCLLFFLVGFFCLLLYLESCKLPFRIVSLIFFFLSFEMNSLMLFYLVIALYVWWKDSCFKDFKVFIKYWDFILIALAYVSVKHFFLQPQGAYVDYNKFSLDSFIKTPYYLLKSLYDYLVELPFLSFRRALSSSLFLLVFPIIFFGIKPLNIKEMKVSFRQYIVALGLIVIGLLPYLLVGKLSFLSDYSIRHSVVLGPGIALFFSAVIISISQKLEEKIGNIISSVILGVFFLGSFAYTVDLYNLSLKIGSLVENIRVTDEFSKGKTFIIEEESNNSNHLFSQDINTFYVFTGIFYDIFGDETRLMVPDLDTLERYRDKAVEYPHLRYREWVSSAPEYSVSFYQKNEKSFIYKFKLAIFYFLDQERYRDLIRQLFILEVSEINI